jgi:predicted flap endonuclease-1-like 5' DNA nuclease
MSSFLWLLLYLAPLLGLTAAVFGWFGWQWRGRDMQQRIKELEARLNEARPQEEELPALRDELKSAQSEIRKREDDTAKAHEAVQALETETARLLRDLDLLRTERDRANTALAAVQAELTELRSAAPAAAPFTLAAPEVPAKPKRKRSTTPKAKATPPASLHNNIASLETRLAEQQAEGAAADANEIERLQNQIRVLHQAETHAAALAGVADDDLTQIKGIKKVINEQLNAHGIRTWRQIAQWNDDELRAFSEILAFKNRATREKWREQARALHEAARGPLS